jgi:hypothetical protein
LTASSRPQARSAGTECNSDASGGGFRRIDRAQVLHRMAANFRGITDAALFR